MAQQYRCKGDFRRAAVLDESMLNGIDYLEVVDTRAAQPALRQRTLLLRCLRPVAGLTKDHVRIEGGTRVRDIQILWAHAAPALSALAQGNHPLLSPTEASSYAGLKDAANVLVIRTSAAGDYSFYDLRLVAEPGSQEPHPAFDPELASLAFSFKVECPSDFDCQHTPRCAKPSAAAPPIDYLAKDYASLRRLILDRLATTAPDWRERSAADLGITIVELMAYAGDYLSYFQDAVATEAYLGTARRRPSARRHARLLDYTLSEGCNARTWVHFQVEAANVPLAKGTAIFTRVPAKPVRFLPHSSAFEEVLFKHPVVFETLHAAVLRQDLNQISFYAWDREDCCLPRGATRATLEGHPAGLAKGTLLVFEEIRDPKTHEWADADPTHRHVVRVTRIAQREDPVHQVPVTDIEWAAEDALPFPLCISSTGPAAGGEAQEVAVARGNLVLADHGRTVEAQALVPPEVPGRGRYRPQLQNEELTFAVPYDEAAAPSGPARAGLFQEPREALPQIVLAEGTQEWLPQRDLLASDRFAREFVVENETDGTSRLRFGDGTLGALPAPGTRFEARYRVGNGRRGNVGADSLAHVVTEQDGITLVRNPLPAEGGQDPEPLDQVRMDAPQAFRVQERAVTEDDYRQVAMRHPHVQRAVARFRWTGSWLTVFLTIDRKDGRPVDALFERELVAFLEKYRLAGHDVEVERPRFVPLDIAMGVCVRPGYRRGDVHEALVEAFGSQRLPDGRLGFFHPDRFTFGTPVFLSDVVAAAMAVPGVGSVDMSPPPAGLASIAAHFLATPAKPVSLLGLHKPKVLHRFQRWGQPTRNEFTMGVLSVGPYEIIRLDNDPARPENGRIEFYLEGGI